MAAWKLSSLQFLKSTYKVERGVFFYFFFFFAIYNHLKKDDSNTNQRIHEGDFKEGFQKNYQL